MGSQSTPWPAVEAAPGSRRGVYLKTFFYSLFSIAFVLGGLYFGLVFLRNVSTVIAAAAPGAIGARFQPLSPLAREGGIAPPVAAAELEKRITFLLLGVDRRQSEINEPTRTDTMLLATYDPHTKTAGLLSIPRDLWVPIPISRTEVIEDRINTAHLYGDLYKYPGGGPALSKAAVEYNFGVKIDHYARIDFDGFERLVDMVGGITVDVPYAIKDDEYPTPDYGTERIYFPAGLQHLDGKLALKYARTRHFDSDLGRARRQQQILLAFREQALRLNLLPKAPALLQQLGSSITTDLSVGEMVELAQLAQAVEPQSVATHTLAPPAVTPLTTQMGADILLPNRPEIAKAVGTMFFDGRLKDEAAIVDVVNRAGVDGMGNRVVRSLQQQGITAALSPTTTDAPKLADRTEILVFGDKTYTAGVIADLLRVDRGAIHTEQRATAGGPDLRIVVGRDATVPLAAPE